MLNNVAAVIFDVDGTIVDSMKTWEKINNDFFGSLGITLDDYSMKTLLRLSFPDCIDYCLKNFKTTYSAKDIRLMWNKVGIEYYRDTLTLKEGVREFLEFLKVNNYKVGIASNNSSEIVNFFIRKENIADKFDFVCTSDDIEFRKPNPMMFLKVAKELGVSHKNCIVFEDSEINMRGAKDAGMKVCAVIQEEKINNINNIADYQIKSFKELDL